MSPRRRKHDASFFLINTQLTSLPTNQIPHPLQPRPSSLVSTLSISSSSQTHISLHNNLRRHSNLPFPSLLPPRPHHPPSPPLSRPPTPPLEVRRASLLPHLLHRLRSNGTRTPPSLVLLPLSEPSFVLLRWTPPTRASPLSVRTSDARENQDWGEALRSCRGGVLRWGRGGVEEDEGGGGCGKVGEAVEVFGK